MNDEELEARLGRWQPADAPPELLRGLRAAAFQTQARHGSWPMAYAVLSAAWIIIFALWLTTPHAQLTPAPNMTGTDPVPTDASTFTTALAMERSFLSGNNPDQL